MAYSTFVTLTIFTLLAGSTLAQVPGASPTPAPKSSPPAATPSPVSQPPATAPTPAPSKATSPPSPVPSALTPPSEAPMASPTPSSLAPGSAPSSTPEATPGNDGSLNRVAIGGSAAGIALAVALLL